MEMDPSAASRMRVGTSPAEVSRSRSWVRLAWAAELAEGPSQSMAGIKKLVRDAEEAAESARLREGVPVRATRVYRWWPLTTAAAVALAVWLPSLAPTSTPQRAETAAQRQEREETRDAVADALEDAQTAVDARPEMYNEHTLRELEALERIEQELESNVTLELAGPEQTDAPSEREHESEPGENAEDFEAFAPLGLGKLQLLAALLADRDDLDGLTRRDQLFSAKAGELGDRGVEAAAKPALRGPHDQKLRLLAAGAREQFRRAVTANLGGQ